MKTILKESTSAENQILKTICLQKGCYLNKPEYTDEELVSLERINLQHLYQQCLRIPDLINLRWCKMRIANKYLQRLRNARAVRIMKLTWQLVEESRLTISGVVFDKICS